MSKTITNKEREFNKLRRRRLRNIILTTICSVLAVLGLIWSGHRFWLYMTNEITNDAMVDQYVTPINVRVSGYIKKVYFTEHQKVKAGDTLLVLDNSEFRIKLMDAEAALMDAEASGSVLSANITTTQYNVEVSDANIAETAARMHKLELDERRYAVLLAQESVSQQQYDGVRSEYDAMKAKYEALVRQRSLAKSQSSEVSHKRRSVDAVILRKQAELEMAQLNLSYTVVTAPYDGTMGRRSLGEGQLVQAGQVLSYIVRDDGKWVTANYKETQIANIYVGQSVRIRVDAIKNRVFQGRVTAISDATGSKYSLIPTDNSAGNFVKIQQRIPVRIEFEGLSPEDNALLRAGMMVQTDARIRK